MSNVMSNVNFETTCFKLSASGNNAQLIFHYIKSSNLRLPNEKKTGINCKFKKKC